MSIIGIVAEFDPFHKGHEYLIAQARSHCGGDAIVAAAMSGDFTQRGSCASFDRHVRTELALRGGADLVVELPLPWAISSAEAFAQGGIAALLAAGIDTLAFGSECADVSRLERIAAALEDPAYPDALKQALTAGCSFAAARQRALEMLIGPDAKLLEQPNDLLGVSYLAALRRAKANVNVIAIPRKGPCHNASAPSGGLSSASAIRSMLCSGRQNAALAAVPFSCRSTLERALTVGKGPADLHNNERAVLTRLRLMTPEDFLRLPDVSEGLENRLYRAAQSARSLDGFYDLARSKRYPLARIRRLTLWAYLGLEAADRPDTLPYLRILGMNSRGQEVLHRRKKAVPLLTKPTQARQMGAAAKHLFSLEVRAADLWQLCLPTLDHCEGGSEWRSSPIRLGQR